MNFYNYNTNQHRHICEIKQELQKFTDEEVLFSFNPHILPIFQGMMSTIYCELKKGVTKKDLINHYIKNICHQLILFKIMNQNQNLVY